METELLSTTSTDQEPKKRGRPPKSVENVDQLIDRVHNLELLLVRMAHQSGLSHGLIRQAGLEPYSPSSADMSKFRKMNSAKS